MDKINLDRLILFDDIRRNLTINHAVKIFNEFLDKGDIADIESDYYSVQREIFAATVEEDIEGTYWQNYLCKLVAQSENKFSLMGEKGISDSKIERLAARELIELKKMFGIDWETIVKQFDDTETSIFLMKTTASLEAGNRSRESVKEALMAEENIKSVTILSDYYGKWGCGIYEQYEAFNWDEGLVGVQNYDRISFDQLVGYEKQREQLVENTAFFLKGYRANNVLLYGDRGTGKSSSVKALLSEFQHHKLKILSLNKNHVKDLYKILESIAGRGCKFIIFIDDLSFEETEMEYKYFKSVIEGGIEAQPTNVLIYVTSNRRNIIRETWKDRSAELGDVNHNDGIQERMSLADRFGLSITFTAPDKKTYVEIVKELARQEKLNVTEEELIAEALTWEIRHNGRSGRVAKQFIYHMKAKTHKA